MKRRRLWAISGLLLLLAAGGYIGYSQLNPIPPTSETEQEEELQTTTARQGELTISATGAGTVIANQEINLAFETPGTLTELNVQVGDQVTAGDLLARVDDTDAQQSLVNAQIALSKSMMQSDSDATTAGVSFLDISVQQAEISLTQAQQHLEDLLTWAPDETDIAIAEANLEAARASLNSAEGQNASTGYGIELQAINLQQAQRDLEDAQAAVDIAYDPGRDWEVVYTEPICDTGEQEPCTGQTYAERIERERESADSALLRAQENLSIAQIQYNQTLANSAGSSTANAETSVLNAEAALESALTGPTEDEIETAEIAVQQAELAIVQLELNRESNLLDLEQAQLNVTSAEATIDGTTLIAPIDGTVMAVNGSIGENIGTTSLVLLADLSQPMVEIFLDESDLNMVGLGFSVEVVFDAFPDDTYSGTIVQVDPQLTVESGLNVIRALVQLDADSFAKPQTLPVGLNATVEVIGGRSENAILIPVEALRELTPDTFSVFVVEDGELTLRTVEVGLMDFTFAEITSGLEAGEIVTTGIVETD